MGFFSKLFGKDEAQQPVTQPQAAAPVSREAEPLSINAAAVIALLGGGSNIVTVQHCAVTRIRVELKTPVTDVEKISALEGISACMVINNKVLHLLAGMQAGGAAEALKAELAA